MNFVRQFWALLRVNLAGLPARLGLVCTIVIGVACAVGVLVSMLAMGVGARQEAMGNVSPNRATLTSIDAPSPAQSNISQDAATLIRGLTDYQPELHITAGRMFTPGVRELIVSNKCVRQYTDFSVGSKRHMRGGDWTVVGNFDLASTVCIVFADSDTILSAFGRNTYNNANVMLESPAAFAVL